MHAAIVSNSKGECNEKEERSWLIVVAASSYGSISGLTARDRPVLCQLVKR